MCIIMAGSKHLTMLLLIEIMDFLHLSRITNNVVGRTKHAITIALRVAAIDITGMMSGEIYSESVKSFTTNNMTNSDIPTTNNIRSGEFHVILSFRSQVFALFSILIMFMLCDK